MKTNVKLLKELLKIVYTKELLGKALYERLNDYPYLKEKCDVLEDMATSYEVSVLEGTEGKDGKEQYKQRVVEEMMAVHNIALTLPLYRQSEIYFDNNVLNVNLI